MRNKALYCLPLALLFMFLVVMPTGTIQAADYPPPGTTAEIVSWTWWGDDSSLKSYYKLTLEWTDDEGTHTMTVSAWCVDAYVYGLSPEVVVVPSWDYDDIPDYAKDDEEWDKINYLMHQWRSKTRQIYKDCSWKDIQQAIWYFGDAGYTINSQTPKGSSANINAIIADVEDNGAGYSKDFSVVICLGGMKKQLTFFEIPEVALGTITSLGTMVGAFILNKKRKSP